MQDVRRLALDQPAGHRPLALALVAGLGALVATAAIAAVLVAAGGGASGSWPALVRLGVAVGLAAGSWYALPTLVTSFWWSQRRRPRVVLDDSFVRIDDPSVFRSPVLLTRADIAGVDDIADRDDVDLAADGLDAIDPATYVGAYPTTPNVRIHLARPLTLPEARSSVRLNREMPYALPRPDHAAGALVLTFAQPDRAVPALRAWLSAAAPGPAIATPPPPSADVVWWRRSRVLEILALEGLVVCCFAFAVAA